MARMTSSPDERGFSLSEALVVSALMGLMALVAMGARSVSWNSPRREH